MKALDPIFKVGLLVLLVVFIVIYYLSSQNGRYQYDNSGFPRVSVFDTQTGRVHVCSFVGGGNASHMDAVNNKITREPIE